MSLGFFDDSTTALVTDALREEWEPMTPKSHPELRPTLPEDSERRKTLPMARGLLDYFPSALGAVAEVSRAGNEKHNPGEPLHWSRGKSTDHADTIIRHLADRGLIDSEDGLRHSAKLAWRALAILQEELEAGGAAPGRGSTFPLVEVPGEIVEVPAPRWKHYDLPKRTDR